MENVQLRFKNRVILGGYPAIHIARVKWNIQAMNIERSSWGEL